MAQLKIIVIYGFLLAALSLFLAWVEFGHFMRLYSKEFYVFIIAILFTMLGIYVGRKIAKPQSKEFAKNIAAIQYLGISAREQEVLELIALGRPNKIIARELAISPNTVKTHISNLFEKLEANNRTEAIQKARNLQILQ